MQVRHTRVVALIAAMCVAFMVVVTMSTASAATVPTAVPTVVGKSSKLLDTNSTKGQFVCSQTKRWNVGSKWRLE